MGVEGRTITESCLTLEQWQDSQKNEAWFWQEQKKVGNKEQYHRNCYYRGFLEDGCDIAKRFFEQDFSDKLVVDVGSGPEGILHVINAGRKIAVDPLMNVYIEQGYDVYADNVECLSMMGENFELDEPADVILCLNAIDHTQDPDVVVKNIAHNLKIGGEFLLITDMRKPDQLDVYHKLSIDMSDIHNWILFDKRSRYSSRYIGLEIIEENEYPHQPGNPVKQYIGRCRKYF